MCMENVVVYLILWVTVSCTSISAIPASEMPGWPARVPWEETGINRVDCGNLFPTLLSHQE